MLKIEVDGKNYLNPNEELRNQMRDIVKEYDEKFENNQLLFMLLFTILRLS